MSHPAVAYHFLSLCLLYPEPALADQLQAAAPEAWMEDLVTLFGAEALESLQIEHTRLFMHDTDGVPCPPYEAAYRDGQLLTATTAAVAAFYQEWGLAQSLETADYLPVELQFVAYLAEVAAQSDKPGPVEETRRRFEQEHLGQWLPRFARDLVEQARLPFYRAVGHALGRLAPDANSSLP